jgi:hypothetical protein
MYLLRWNTPNLTLDSTAKSPSLMHSLFPDMIYMPYQEHKPTNVNSHLHRIPHVRFSKLSSEFQQ